jgi:hypothetical protein
MGDVASFTTAGVICEKALEQMAKRATAREVSFRVKLDM